MEEVKEAVFGMKLNKAPGPDGLPIEFYQKFWNLVSGDLMDLFEEFYVGKLDLSRFNSGIVTLLPKVADASCIQQYRPICMLNVVFKIFTKVINNRVVKLAKKIISPVQTAFIKDRNILDDISILHESLHEVR